MRGEEDLVYMGNRILIADNIFRSLRVIYTQHVKESLFSVFHTTREASI